MKLSKYIYITKAAFSDTEDEKYFLFSTRSSLSILVDYNTLIKLQNDDFSELDETQRAKLKSYLTKYFLLQFNRRRIVNSVVIIVVKIMHHI